MTTTLSSREFNQDTSGAKKAANEGPCSLPTEVARPMCCFASRIT